MPSDLSSDENFIRLRDLLREMFQLDKGYLDFGLYRIMNMKSAEVEEFISNDLPPLIEGAVATIEQDNLTRAKKEYEEAQQKAREVGLGDNLEQAPVVKIAKEKLRQARESAAQPTEIYKHLHNFFGRYYDSGDFLSLRRYKASGKEAYLIPYNGEEVKLHWANADQYYIKTAANYQSYIFTVGSDDSLRRVRFHVVDANVERDNIKEADDQKRRFVLSKHDAVTHDEEGTLLIAFEHRPLTTAEAKQYVGNGEAQQRQLNGAARDKILKKASKLDDTYQYLFSELAPTEKNPERTILGKHLETYVAKNEFDYFIHKDLEGFLRRELDFYLKNEVLFLEDIERDEGTLARAVTMMKAVRTVAHQIIVFLAQIEEFQKQLWLKKKFVLETNYCITLDRIPESLYDDILANKQQIDEWKKLFAIDELLQGKKPDGAFLASNQFLVLDTGYFAANFTDQLLAALSDTAQEDGTTLEDTMDGVLIHGENFQALNLLQERYREQVQCIYIDPPFNLGETAEYQYRVDYKDSTWLSLLENRISQSLSLLSNDGSSMVRCNHDGNMLLRLLLTKIFGSENFRNEIVVRRAEISKGDLNKQFEGVKSITVNYDNLYWYSREEKTRFRRFLKETSEKQAKAQWHPFWKAEDRPNLRYEILGIDLTNHYGQWMWKKERTDRAVRNYENFVKSAKSDSDDELEKYWQENNSSFFEENGYKLEFVRRMGNGYSSIKYWIPPRTHVMADNNWLDIKGFANKWNFKTENSEALLQRVIETLSQKGDYVLDFFAGSGTTAATAHKMKRRWIAIEMGNQFDLIAKLRMPLVLSGEKSGISKKEEWEGGGFFKYMRLESHEDTLDSLEMNKPDGDLLSQLEQKELLTDYHLRYALTYETRASATLLGKEFGNPDRYTLNVVRDGSAHTEYADLAETFNYLLGIEIMGRWRMDGVLAITGVNRKGTKHLILWRDMDDMPNNKLESWFKKHCRKFGNDVKVIYVNGDQTLNAIKAGTDTWEAQSIEPTFRNLMFEAKK